MSRNRHHQDDEPFVIRIHCGVSGFGHRKKGVLITTFRYTGSGWTEIVRGEWRREHLTALNDNTPGSHEMLLRDRIPSRQESIGLYPGSDDAKALRAVYSIACPVCSPDRTPRGRAHGARGGVVLQLREENLFAALDATRHAGIHDLPMALLAAIVDGMAKA